MYKRKLLKSVIIYDMIINMFEIVRLNKISKL